jgi:hypothetical protein
MNQIYRNGVVYREINVDSLSEIQIQHAMHSFITQSLSDWTCYLCDLFFQRNGVGKKCDLVLIHKTKHLWCAVEIERSMHSIFGHVLPQLSVLIDGVPDPKTLSEIVYSHDREEVRQHIQTVFLYGTRMVCVLTPFSDLKWEREIRQYQCHSLSIHIYNSIDGDRLYHLSGDWDILTSKFIGHAQRSKSIPSNIRIPFIENTNSVQIVSLPNYTTGDFVLASKTHHTVVTTRNNLVPSRKYNVYFNESERTLIIR